MATNGCCIFVGHPISTCDTFVGMSLPLLLESMARTHNDEISSLSTNVDRSTWCKTLHTQVYQPWFRNNYRRDPLVSVCGIPYTR